MHPIEAAICNWEGHFQTWAMLGGKVSGHFPPVPFQGVAFCSSTEVSYSVHVITASVTYKGDQPE